jgi:hypothetical protein
MANDKKEKTGKMRRSIHRASSTPGDGLFSEQQTPCEPE